MSKQLSMDEKLLAISTLPVGRGGIASYDANDVQWWCALAGPKFDTGVLSDLTLERINALYFAHFD